VGKSCCTSCQENKTSCSEEKPMNEVKFINENIDDLKKIVKELEGASKMHKDQSVRIQKYIDDMKESVNEGKLDRIGSQLIKDLDKKYKNQKGTISTFNKIKKDLRKKMPRVSDRVAGSIANQYNDFLLDKDIKPKEKLRLMVLTLKGLGMNESVNEVSGVDVAKKVLKNKQREKGIDLQTANLIVTIDKAYDKNPKLQKKFRAIQLPKMKQLIMKYYG